ncbi:MAG: hypothetical protein AMXMBFR64_10220 [Myxococcales bacterium]
MAALLGGCLEELPKPSKVDGLRVLGVQAEPPELAPGGTTELRALVADPEGRPVKLEWYACQVPERGQGLFEGGGQSSASGGGGYALDSKSSCADPELIAAGASVRLGTGPTVSYTVPLDALSEEAIRFAYGLPEDGRLPIEAQIGLLTVAGVNTTISLVATVPGAKPLEAFKRLNVSLASPANKNPTGIAFALRRADDQSEAPKAGTAPEGECFVSPVAIEAGEWVIQALNMPDPGEPYPVIVGGTSIERPFELLFTEETWFYSTFSTAGSISPDIVKSSQAGRIKWTLDETPTEPVDVWIVVRDGRGGTAWCHSVLAPE